jgi:uncharacterized damage-inducible protein DinB
MTLQEIKLLHAYNAWSNNRIFNAVSQLPTDQYMTEMKSSHGSIYGTLVHIVGGEKLWQSRWRGTAETALLTARDVPSLTGLRSIWEEVGRGTAAFIGTLTDRKLSETLRVKSLSAGTVTLTYWQSFQHIVDHSTYHRGQIVTMMRQLDATPPPTAMLLFYRETGKHP